MEGKLQVLIGWARSIDRLNAAIGRASSWLILAAIAISAGNAIVRKTLDTSSNAWLEIQWWLFAAVFLFAAPWTLQRGEHIRIDVVSSRRSRRWRDLAELAGLVLFLLPVAATILVTSAVFAANAWAQNEQALNAGGLPQWPIKSIIPAAAALLFLQGLSELVKQIDRMRAASRGEPEAPATSR